MKKFNYPSPAKPEIEKVILPNNIRPYFMSEDDDGNVIILGRSPASTLWLSEDNGATWRKIYEGVGDVRHALWINNPDRDKSVLLFGYPENNQISRSTDLNSSDPTTWETVLTSDSGKSSSIFGWDLHDNNVFASFYGTHDGTNPPRHAYRSRDYGATWEMVFSKPISEMVNPSNFHIHDICFDPWANRIWVSCGDSENSNIYYSDNNGVDWKKVFDTDGKLQPTHMTALPDRVVFGSDRYPNGIMVYHKNKHENNAIVKPDDLEFIFSPNGKEEIFDGAYAINQNVSTKLITKNYPYNMLIPYTAGIYKAGEAPSQNVKIIATPDGENYYEIMNVNTMDDIYRSVTNVVGPVPSDPNKYIYINLANYDGSNGETWRLKMPEWVLHGGTEVEVKNFPQIQNVNNVGSNIELVAVEELTISPGSTNYNVIEQEMSPYNFYRIGVKEDSNTSHDYEVNKVSRGIYNSNLIDFEPAKTIITQTGFRFISTKFEVESSHLRIGLNNKDLSTHIYQIFLYGVK